MKSDFKYLLDPLFLSSLVLYLLNKLSFLSFIKLRYNFTTFYLNDLLLIPVLLPAILFLSKSLYFRTNNDPPKLIEIVVPLLIWSLAFEFIGPNFFYKGTSDLFDVIAYSVGGFISWLIWNRVNILKCFHYKHFSN